MPRVSVIIPTFNRPAHVAKCLESLARMKAPRGGLEVVVVDDGGSETLLAIVAPFASRINARLLRQENAGPAAARNRGALAARGEILLFTDDDCRPHPLWARRMVAALERGGTGALAGGATFNQLRGWPCSDASQLIVALVYEFYNADAMGARFFASNNMGCWREAFVERGGFNADFRRSASEDRELCDRWRALGGRLVFEPRAVIGHRHALTLRKYWGQHFFSGRGANLYHRLRSVRGSGKMTEDMGFHARLPGMMWRRLPPMGARRAATMLVLLGVWQVANAAGFFWDRWQSPELPDVDPFPPPLREGAAPG